LGNARGLDAAGPTADEYCNIRNPFQYDTSIMSHPDQVAAHIQDSANLYTDISRHTLPAVSFVKSSEQHEARQRHTGGLSLCRRHLPATAECPTPHDRSRINQGGLDSGIITSIELSASRRQHPAT
jgi:hypothetical protein